MNVADPVGVGLGDANRIAAAPGDVASIEEELHRRSRAGHEAVDFRRRLNDSAHVMMVDELEAKLLNQLSEAGHPRQEDRPLGVG